MLVPIKWLYEFVPCDKSAKELAELFISKGVEVKNITRIGEKLEGFVVAEVQSIDNNKLTLFDGKSNYQIATVTYHLKVGDKIGYHQKNCKWLNPELIGLSEDTLPFILNQDYETGTKVLNYLDDYVLDFEILPNRGDLMSVIGLAYELASYEEINAEVIRTHKNRQEDAEKNQRESADNRFSENLRPISSGEYQIKDLVDLQVLDKQACPDYIARLICDVKVMPSPFWLQWRLLAVGLRPINNIVDAGNYIMAEYGTPLHTFDFDKLVGQTIQVRFAKKGEKIRTIDNVLRNLDEKVLLIADKKFPVAIAGIMGGQGTEISPLTKRVLLECARFSAPIIRRGSKSIALATEASQRFEMGIDSEKLETASLKASMLIAELGKGVLAKDKVEVRTEEKPVTIKISPEKINRLLGINLDKERVKKILSKLNCKIKQDNGVFTLQIPSYRLDLSRDIDVIEEIGRIYGYENLPSVFSLRGSEPGATDTLSQQIAKIRNFFISLGFIENYTVSFCNEQSALQFSDGNIVKLPNPLNERYGVMRPSILVTLLDVVKLNYARGNKNLRLFEIGKVFETDKEVKETINITAVITGQPAPIFWKKSDSSSVDYFDIKGVAESFLDDLLITDCDFVKTDIKYLVTNNAVRIKYADTELGCLGEIKKSVLDQFDIPVPVYALEINLPSVLKLAPSYRFFKTLPRFPPIVRDFAFIVDDKISAAKMTDAIKKIAGALLESVEIFDYFKGKPLPASKRNLGIRITLRSEERTLNKTEVNKIFDRIVKSLKEKMQVELRSESGNRK